MRNSSDSEITNINWLYWGAIDLDDFRTQFPEFRQSEITAIDQIISGTYKQNKIEPHIDPVFTDVFNKFKSTPEIKERATEWFTKLNKKVNVKHNSTPITPTIIATKRKK